MDFKYIVGQAQIDLSNRTKELIKLVQEEEIETLVFLDRSARPASWLFESFWSSSEAQPTFVFVCTGKKGNLIVDASTLEQFEREFKPKEKYLKGKKILMVDDIEKDGAQRRFVGEVLSKLYHPAAIGYFEWNKLGGLRLPHGLSYEDDGSFIAKEDESKKETVNQIKKEITELTNILF